MALHESSFVFACLSQWNSQRKDLIFTFLALKDNRNVSLFAMIMISKSDTRHFFLIFAKRHMKYIALDSRWLIFSMFSWVPVCRLIYFYQFLLRKPEPALPSHCLLNKTKGDGRELCFTWLYGTGHYYYYKFLFEIKLENAFSYVLLLVIIGTLFAWG